ncbi:MAG: hypothetical protein C5B52_00430 [Bacteroidetes bacterium]|nr:MAG: hypothetical protein C5B52_00430 [Bacteroidota bacterium]
MQTPRIQEKNYNQIAVAIYAATAAFLTYASVYAYRKAFTVATFEGIRFWGIPYQTLLIISQVIGYMASKFYGIKFIAELKRMSRWKVVTVLMLIAWIALLFFALVPPPYGIIFLFINGFPLGLLWGIVFSYVEGRRTTDFIGSALAVSFIFSSGFVKSVAKWLMIDWHVSEKWMPFVTGAVFVIPMIIFVYMLEKLPPPTEEDIKSRTIRLPMNKEDRRKFVRAFTLGLVLVVITYFFLSIMRDIRDNFMANIWNELGYGDKAGIFTQTETPISLMVLLIMSMLVLIKSNIRAFRLIHLIVIISFLISGISSWLFLNGQINGITWMILVGLGLYTGYVPYNSIFFERMIAVFRVSGNVGFLIYISDAFGYLGSVAVMLSKEVFQIKVKWSVLYPNAVVIFSIVGFVTTLISLIYFNRKYSRGVSMKKPKQKAEVVFS